MNIKAATFLFFSFLAAHVVAEDLLAVPDELWAQQIFGPSGSARFSYGNGVFLVPDESTVLTVTTNGKVSAYEALGRGDFQWDVQPPPVEEGSANAIECLSGLAFTTENAETPYMVYSIGYRAQTDTDTDYTLVVAISFDGEKLYESPKLQGLHAGTPVISDNGKFVFLTHNSADRSTGYFSILSESLELVVTRSNESGPFAPPGIYHSPAEGFYDIIDNVADGTGNTNDMILWSLAPVEDGQPVPPGTLYGFQFPSNFDGVTGADTMDFFSLGSATRAFRTILPPVIADEGRSSYWGATRSELYAFVGYEGLNRARFNRSPNLRDEDFAENDAWGGQSIWALPALSTADNGDGLIFGATASTEVYRLSYGFSALDDKVAEWTGRTVVTTSSFVYASPKVDPLKRAIYYVESNGVLHQADFNTLQDLWEQAVTIENGVSSEMAISKDGSVVWVVSTQGRLRAIRVAEEDISESPTSFPTTPLPTFFPTTAAPTVEKNTDSPSKAPTVPPTPPAGEPSSDVPDGDDSASVGKPLLFAFATVFMSTLCF